MARRNVRPKSASADAARASEGRRWPATSPLERIAKALKLGRRGRRWRALACPEPPSDRACLVVSWAMRHAGAVEPTVAVTLLVDLEGEPSIEPSRLREALASELGRPVVLEPDARGGTLDVQQRGAQARVYFETADGRRDGRSMPLPSNPEDAVAAIALLAENLMQDQAPESEAAQREAEAEADREATPSISRPPSSRSTCGDGPMLPLGLDFGPYLGASSTEEGRGSGRNFSFGLIAALYGGVDGLALSGTANIDTGSACGLELASAANITRGSLDGLQLAGIANVAGEVSGAQISGTLNVASQVTGLQLGAVDISAGPVRGAQIGVITYAEESDFTLGVVNVTAGRVHGLQVGVVNYAEDTDFSLGVFNIVANGRWHLEAWTLPEAEMLLAAVKHGGAHFHYLYGAGTRPADAEHVWPLIGLGAHVTFGENPFFDPELLSHTEIASNPNQLIQARLRLGYRFSRSVPA